MTEASFSTESTPRLGDIAIVSCLAHSLRRKCEKEKDIPTTEEKSFNHSERYVLKVCPPFQITLGEADPRQCSMREI